MKFMYTLAVDDAGIPLGRFNQTTVDDAVLLGFDSIHAYTGVPPAPYGAPAVNSTFDHWPLMYCAYAALSTVIISWKFDPVADDCEFVSVIGTYPIAVFGPNPPLTTDAFTVAISWTMFD